MPFEKDPARRDFLKSFGGIGLASAVRASVPEAIPSSISQARPDGHSGSDILYPRTFTGASLKMISFPLGGIGAGSIGLGGRGQLRDWEIFNRPDIGNSRNMRSQAFGWSRKTVNRRRTFSSRASSHPMKAGRARIPKCARALAAAVSDVYW